MAVLQCPVCELRFRTESDLDDHLKLDHPDFEATPADEDPARRFERDMKGGKRHPLEP